MNILLRVLLLIGIVLFMAIISIMIKKRNFDLKYSLIWMLFSVLLAVCGIFPAVPQVLSKWMGIEVTSNFIFVIIIVFILLVLISLTSAISKKNAEVKMLIQQLSILKKELSEKEND